MMDFSSGCGTSTSSGEKDADVFLAILRTLRSFSEEADVPVARTLWVQQARHSQVSLCNSEGLFQVLQVGLLVHSAHVNESGAGEHKHGLSS